MQKRISSFFGNAPAPKRVKSDPPARDSDADGEESSPKKPRTATTGGTPPIDESVAARIAANRAAAVAKLQARADRAAAAPADARAPLEPSWRRALSVALTEPYWAQLQEFVTRARASTTVYPEPEVVFSALNNCPLARVKVVIIGQDPYHGPRQAHGMCFSVNRDVPVPPSLQNIYKELGTDMPGWKHPGHGNLEHWAKQGVLLLNSVLTVEAHKANSHKGRGWERFTDAVVSTVNKREGKGCVFLLWGNPARLKGKGINQKKHCVLTSVHPSPLSASQGFFGSKHFSKANEYLIETRQTPIDWHIPK